MKTKLTSFLILILTCIVLSYGKESAYYAKNALLLWFNNLVPVLFPFMILSNLFITFGGIEGIMPLFQPILGKLFQTSAAGSYCILVSMLFGMPMGSLTLSNLLKQEKISVEEAQWLFLFCNQLSPAYMCNFVLPLFQLKCSMGFLLGFYGIPLLYGKILYFMKRPSCSDSVMVPCETSFRYLSEINLAIQKAGIAILCLGAYMILFQLLFLYEPILHSMHLFSPVLSLIKPALEISSGLKACPSLSPRLGITYCAFGGICCIAQTAYSVRGTVLESKMSVFLLHRMILTCIVGIYFFFLY